MKKYDLIQITVQTIQINDSIVVYSSHFSEFSGCIRRNIAFIQLKNSKIYDYQSEQILCGLDFKTIESRFL